ncbi:MAG: ABC transporter permease, partial [Blastocatellia bacterium]
MFGSGPTIRFRFWLWLIALVGVIVPRRLRADWRQEWEAELRHREAMLAEWDRLDWRNKLDLLRRSASAFWEALWLQPRRWEDEMIQDLRFGVRMLLKAPGFAFAAVLTLALGIGATTAIFTLINATLLNRLPFNAPERLTQLANHEPRVSGNRSVSYPDFEDWRAQAASFDAMAASGPVRLVFTGADASAESLVGEYVSPDYFRLFGVAPLLGRTFLPEETAMNTGVHAVIVLSEGYWQRRFGGDPQIIGRTVATTDGQFVVVGVMP